MSTIQLIQVTPDELVNLIKEGVKTELQTLSARLAQPQTDQKELLTRKETATYFSVSLVTIHDWMNEGIIKPYKVGNRTFFKHSELLEVVANSNRA